MLPSIVCPSCVRPLGKVHPEGSSQVKCFACGQTFGVLHGKLSGWMSQWEAMLYVSPRLPSFYKRRYELRITTPGRDLKLLKFSIPGQNDRVPVRLGDRISVFYTLQGNVLKKLIAIQNHSIGKRYRLSSPVPSLNHLLTRGAISVGALSCVAFGGVGLTSSVVVGAIALWVYSRLIDTAELSTPEPRLNHPSEARLVSERNLVEQKHQISDRVETLRSERHSHQDLIQRLLSLRKRMAATDMALYSSRIGAIETAVRILKQRMEHNQLLIDEYAQTIQMIEIELETSYLTEQLPEVEDFTHTILQRLEELKAIEERNRNLRIQLEANEEVRRLSFGI